MLPFKYRKKIVQYRKLPKFRVIGYMPELFMEQRLLDCSNSSDTTEKSKKNNVDFGDYGFLDHYSQRHLSGTWLPEVFDIFGNMYDLRYAILEKDKKIPWHIDIPKGHRFIAMLKGSHLYKVEGNKHPIEMLKGEIWFINASYRHEIENTTNGDRVALLGKFNDTTQLLRAGTRR